MTTDESRWPFVQSVWHQPEVDSTNDWARRLIDAGVVAALPALVWADAQTKGRGQGTNTWWSDSGSLTASVVVDPEVYGIAVAIRPRVALGVAAAVVAAVGEVAVGCSAGIRWPNDIELGGKKLGGILVEGVVSSEGPRLIIGVGLNVATRLDRAPADVQRLATSLAGSVGAPGPRDLLAAILARLDAMLRALGAGDPLLSAAWSRLDCLAGLPITVQAGSNLVRVVALGIDETGGLRVQHGDGQTEVLFAGRILRE